jgi:drug/metabolite transporter (DMT)-like permease
MDALSTALIAWAVFGEELTLTAATGMLLAVSGVYLVARTK